MKMITKMEEEIKQDKFRTMKELHSLGSAFKAYYMQETLDSFFVLRELIGANGLLRTSNMPKLIEVWSPFVTLEGDAMVMYQQTAKALFKKLKKVSEGGKVHGSFEYLNEIYNFKECIKIDDVCTMDFLSDVIKFSSLYQIEKTSNLLNSNDGLEKDSKWNKKYQAEIVKSVKLHAIYTTLKMFWKEVEILPISDSLKTKLIML